MKGFFILCIGLLTPFSSFSADADNELNDLLQGFDSPTTETQSNNIDDLMSGFEDEKPIGNTTETQIKKTEKKWSLTTLLSFSTSYNYQQSAPSNGNPDYRGLSRVKTKIQPEFRYKFNTNWDSLISASAFYDAIFRINDRSKYTSDTLDSNENEIEFREVYLRGTLSDNLDIKLGRQIVVWGKSDSIRIVDILNPLDFREPGMVDIEDLRLPVTMLKADYYFSDWNLSAIVIPEFRFNKTPAYGSSFSLSDSPPPDENNPSSLTDAELALSLNGVFTGWDLSFYLADYYNDQARITFATSQVPGPVHQVHSRLTMIGTATNIALGNWLVKFESAYIDGIEFSFDSQKFSRTDIMLGLDYSGLSDTTLSVEVANRHINDLAPLLNPLPNPPQEDDSQISLRYTGSFMREKLKLVALASILGTSTDDGAFYRGSAEYEIMDAMSVMLGGIVYQSGDNFLMKRIAKNDRVFLDFRYSF